MPKFEANPLMAPSQMLLRKPSEANAVKQANARLSSGHRLNSAKDDAASLAIASALRAQVRSSVVAERNIGDAAGMVQTASGGLDSVTGIVSRMRELATQSSNGALNDGDRANIQTEFKSLQDEVGRIQSSTTFNGKQVLREPAPGGTTDTFQVGAASGDTHAVNFASPDLRDLVAGTNSVATADGARAALDTLDKSLKAVSEKQSYFGATLNGFDATVSNAQTGRLASTSAESRLRDADVAEEVSNRARAQIVDAAKTAVLAHALASNEHVLQLIKG